MNHLFKEKGYINFDDSNICINKPLFLYLVRQEFLTRKDVVWKISDQEWKQISKKIDAALSSLSDKEKGI